MVVVIYVLHQAGVTTGVLRRAPTEPRGVTISTIIIGGPGLRTTQPMCVLFGLFSYLIIYQFNASG